MTTEANTLGPDEVEFTLRVPRTAIAAGGLSLILFAGSLSESELRHPAVEFTFRGEKLMALLLQEHAAPRAPAGTNVGRTVTVVATTSVATRAVPLIWEPTKPLEVIIRGQ
jgi:hypothetical protein